jgi:hypothetical protein
VSKIGVAYPTAEPLTEPCVHADLDTLMTALHVEIDDLIGRPTARGRRGLLSSAELICLAVMQMLLRYPSKRHWLRHAHKHLRAMFPSCPGRTATTSGCTRPDRCWRW